MPRTVAVVFASCTSPARDARERAWANLKVRVPKVRAAPRGMPPSRAPARDSASATSSRQRDWNGLGNRHHSPGRPHRCRDSRPQRVSGTRNRRVTAALAASSESPCNQPAPTSTLAGATGPHSPARSIQQPAGHPTARRPRPTSSNAPTRLRTIGVAERIGRQIDRDDPVGLTGPGAPRHRPHRGRTLHGGGGRTPWRRGKVRAKSRAARPRRRAQTSRSRSYGHAMVSRARRGSAPNGASRSGSDSAGRNAENRRRTPRARDHRAHPHIGRQQPGQPAHQPPRSTSAGRVGMRDLPGGVHPGVGAPGYGQLARALAARWRAPR